MVEYIASEHVFNHCLFPNLQCLQWEGMVRTPCDVRYTRALIGRKAYVHPVTYAIPML